MTDDNKTITCWNCPLCPMIYKRRNHFDKHIKQAHQLEASEGKRVLDFFTNFLKIYFSFICLEIGDFKAAIRIRFYKSINYFEKREGGAEGETCSKRVWKVRVQYKI